MAPFRKYGRSRKMSMRRSYRGKKYVRSGKTTLAKLAKQVRTLTSRDRVQTVKVAYRNHDVVNGLGVASPYIGRLLTNYSQWATLWPTTNSAISQVRDKARIKSIMIDNLVTLDNSIYTERSTIDFTYFVFRLKDASGAMPTSSGNPTLVADVDYTTNNGKAYLNLQRFKILYVKRFTLTQAENANGDAAKIQARFTANIKLNTLAKAFDDNWKDMNEDPNESNNVYHVLFNSNSILDSQAPYWEYACIANTEQ